MAFAVFPVCGVHAGVGDLHHNLTRAGFWRVYLGVLEYFRPTSPFNDHRVHRYLSTAAKCYGSAYHVACRLLRFKYVN